MARSLLDCPPEIWDSIFELLPAADLCAICLVSRDLCLRGQPFLYSEIRWAWTFGWSGQPSSEVTPPKNIRVPPIIPFLRTVLQKPEIGALVRFVDLEGDSLSRITHYFRGRPPTLPPFEVRPLIEAIEKMDMPQKDRDAWIQDLSQGTMDALVALFLSRLPNLQHLSLGENFVRDSKCILMLLRWALCEPGYDSPRLFQRVSEVRFQLANDMRYRRSSQNTADHLALFYLPSIEHISISIDNPAQALVWPGENPPRPSRLRSLDLTMLREGYLGQVLSVTNGLRKLRWEWFCNHDTRRPDISTVIDLDKIVDDLCHVRQTLTDLTITTDVQCYIFWGDPLLSVKGSFAPMAGFEALTRLEVPLPFLVGSMSPTRSKPIGSSLPRNLETLVITDDLFLEEEYEWRGPHPLHVIRSWMEDWRTFTPRLRLFQLLLKVVDYEEWGPEMRQELRDIGARVGLHVEITKLAGEMLPLPHHLPG